MPIIITERELSLFLRAVESVKRVVAVRGPDLLTQPLKDWCEFVTNAKVGDRLEKFICTTVLALQITGFIPKEHAKEHIKKLASLGMFPAWEKHTIFNRIKGKNKVLDAWFEVQLRTPGDLIGTTEVARMVSEIYKDRERFVIPVPNIIH